MRTYDVGSQKAQWVLNASLVSLSALLVLGGQLGDMLGRRRVFTFGTIIFAAASACAAFAPTFDLLILCRAVQGAGGALRAGRSRTEAHSRTAESSVDTEGVADSSD
jgi:MFS family permease